MIKKNQIIPVMDLKRKQIVHASGGSRKKYKTVTSSLTHMRCPATIAFEMLKKTKSNILYIADLDAIDGNPLQEGLILEIATKLNNVEIWLDGGFSSFEKFKILDPTFKNLLNKNVKMVPVFSTESMNSFDDAKATFRYYPNAILSLDKKNGGFIGKSEISNFPDFWPDKIILMNLDRVGSCLGPDIEWFQSVKSNNPSKMIFGAGGIKSIQDILKIKSANVAGWLCSSIIHSDKKNIFEDLYEK